MSNRDTAAIAAAQPVATFDNLAPGYDDRAGLPPDVGQAVARSVVEISGAQSGDLVLELGAGTGEIGKYLARLPLQYVGVDSSPEMLAVFHAKAGDNAPRLVVADCDRGWPLPDHVATVLFASRVIHLLKPDHVAMEAKRVCRQAGYLILGRVLRDPDSFKERLRRLRQQLLLEAGITPRQGDTGARRVIERCVLAGGESLGRHVVADWASEATPGAVIETWESMSRIGSFEIESATRTEVLARLWSYARDEFGNLDRPRVVHERYAVDIVRWP